LLPVALRELVIVAFSRAGWVAFFAAAGEGEVVSGGGGGVGKPGRVMRKGWAVVGPVQINSKKRDHVVLQLHG
jgi:hypothetical protein